MKLRVLIQKFKPLPTESRFMYHADRDELTDAVGLTPNYNSSDEWNRRCISHPVATWFCTDTHVGMHFITLDDEVVAVSLQSARKSDVNYEFVSEEARVKLRDFIVSITPDDDKRFPIVDLDEEMGSGYTVDYGSQLLTDKVVVAGRSATVVTKYGLRYEGPTDMWGKVTVQYEDGTTELVDLDKVIIPFNLIGDE